ncbi:putative endo-1,3(4)-beta-glucanase [Aspergillus mulundensis]|uniref:Endo-1,3(4)-beta-glucanase n=1 Tax=Aspergillus mulundensis TaxID=1810919 RepID=A0A3D8QIW4_9EURO|nr:hypothetical protein DSM5745_10434 [Aspergillus mulundensis]RDW61762.1 hypothetical protein DSM5745_10434 [Aspergillus mulundensis]
MSSVIPEDDPLAQRIAILASRQRPFPLSPVLAPGVKLNPDSIFDPGFFRYPGFLGTRNYHRHVGNKVSDLVGVGSAIINRPLTQDELDFYVETTSQQASSTRTAFLIGAGLGFPSSILMSEPRAAFKKYAPPIDQNNPLKFFNRFLDTLKKMREANPALWRRTLFAPVNCSATLAIVLGLIEVASSMSEGVARMRDDPRMKQHNADLRNADKQQADNRRRIALIDHARMLQGKEAVDVFSREDTNENGFEELPSTTPSNQAETSASPSRRLETYTSSTSNDQSMSAWPSSTSGTYTYGAPAANESKESSFFDDDASPIAPVHQDTNTTSAGSAWERIRQQNQMQSRNPSPYQSTSPYPSQPRYERAQPTADSGSDAHRERERAQAEFDRMLEAERHQQDDSDGGSRGSRGGWR